MFDLRRSGFLPWGYQVGEMGRTLLIEATDVILQTENNSPQGLLEELAHPKNAEGDQSFTNDADNARESTLVTVIDSCSSRCFLGR